MFPIGCIVSAVDTNSPVRLTATAQAVDAVLAARGHQPLINLVDDMARDGASNRAIADRIAELTGVTLTYEGVRGWRQTWDKQRSRAAA